MRYIVMSVLSCAIRVPDTCQTIEQAHMHTKMSGFFTNGEQSQGLRWPSGPVPVCKGIVLGLGSGPCKLDPLPWLNVNYTLGYDFASDQRRTVFSLGGSQFPDGRILRDEFSTREIDGNLVVTAVRKFQPADMSLTLMAGQNLNQSDFRILTTQGDGIAVDGFDQLGSTASFSTIERQEIVRIEGYFSQALIDLWDQLYLTAGLRNDGASVFSRGQKRHWYPKFAAICTWQAGAGRIL